MSNILVLEHDADLSALIKDGLVVQEDGIEGLESGLDFQPSTKAYRQAIYTNRYAIVILSGITPGGYKPLPDIYYPEAYDLLRDVDRGYPDRSSTPVVIFSGYDPETVRRVMGSRDYSLIHQLEERGILKLREKVREILGSQKSRQ